MQSSFLAIFDVYKYDTLPFYFDNKGYTYCWEFE